MGKRDTNFVRGVLILLVLGVPCLAAGVLAALAMLKFFVTSWLPQNWFSNNGVDWIWGTGSVGDAANYFRIMVFGGISYATGTAILWGFKG